MEESIKLIKRGEFPKRDSLGNRLREMDGLDVPDALADPDDLPEPKTLSDYDAEDE